MKTSVVITTFNEEKTIAKLIDSLLIQTKKPDEIVIVDGKSKDNTVKIIKAYQRKHKKIRLFVEPGSIAHGRNTAIRNARLPIIAQTDAGCIAKEDWLVKITEPFKAKNVDFVGGFYIMTGKSSLQKAVASFIGIPLQAFNKHTFLPSARSMAFKKSLWQKIGGYSEKFDYAGEDTFFNYQLIKNGVRRVNVKKAIVYWEMPKTLIICTKKFYLYAKGDAQAGIWFHPMQQKSTHNLKILRIFARYLIGLFLLLVSIHVQWLFDILVVGFVLYLCWPVFKMRNVVTDLKARLWLPIIQVISDFAVMLGFIHGFLSKIT